MAHLDLPSIKQVEHAQGAGRQMQLFFPQVPLQIWWERLIWRLLHEATCSINLITLCSNFPHLGCIFQEIAPSHDHELWVWGCWDICALLASGSTSNVWLLGKILKTWYFSAYMLIDIFGSHISGHRGSGSKLEPSPIWDVPHPVWPSAAALGGYGTSVPNLVAP